jgi:MinD superfamily P-loop ATPase
MEKSKKTLARWKAWVDKKSCVACGECVNHCKLSAVSIKNGCYAIVDEDKCVGCKRCIVACPASTIDYYMEGQIV